MKRTAWERKCKERDSLDSDDPQVLCTPAMDKDEVELTEDSVDEEDNQ